MKPLRASEIQLPRIAKLTDMNSTQALGQGRVAPVSTTPIEGRSSSHPTLYLLPLKRGLRPERSGRGAVTVASCAAIWPHNLSVY